MKRIFTQGRIIWLGVAVALGVLVLESQAQIITLTDNNSFAQINTGGQAGMFNWSVNGINQLAQQWFWYRLDGSPEHSIDTISAPVISGLTANTMTTTYNDSLGRFNVSVRYSLSGGSPTSGKADLAEQITINNTSTANLDFHFFQYSDFDLNGTPAGDSVVISKNTFTGLYNQIDQTKGTASLSETVTTPGANHGEAAFFPQTLNELNDAAPTTLNDITAAGPGDVTWALQWDLLALAPGDSFLISKDKRLQVPEPSVLALLSTGLLAWAIRKRRQSA